MFPLLVYASLSDAARPLTSPVSPIKRPARTRVTRLLARMLVVCQGCAAQEEAATRRDAAPHACSRFRRFYSDSSPRGSVNDRHDISETLAHKMSAAATETHVESPSHGFEDEHITDTCSGTRWRNGSDERSGRIRKQNRRARQS